MRDLRRMSVTDVTVMYEVMLRDGHGAYKKFNEIEVSQSFADEKVRSRKVWENVSIGIFFLNIRQYEGTAQATHSALRCYK